MRPTNQSVPKRRRGVRWYPKKSDDSIIERWAAACSRLNDDCRGCEMYDDCQDLADRLIGCISVRTSISRRQRGVETDLSRN